MTNKRTPQKKAVKNAPINADATKSPLPFRNETVTISHTNGVSSKNGR